MTSGAGKGTELTRQLSTAFSRVGAFYLQRTYWQQIFLVLAFLIVKNAFDIELRNVQEAYLPGVQKFPEAAGYFSGSFGQVIVAVTVGVTTTTQWIALHLTLVALVLVLSFLFVNKVDKERRSLLLLVLASATATSSLFISVGKYDVITFLGAVILALASSTPIALFGAFVMASGNPEQAIVASIALLALSFASEFRQIRMRAIGGIVISSASWLLVQLWFQMSEMSVGRLQLIPEYLSESIARVIAFPSTAIWSWLNAGWLLVICVVMLAQPRSRKWVLVALIAVPGIATVVTADGGRVFGLIVLPVYLLVGLWFSRQFDQGSHVQKLGTGMAICALLILPITIQGQGWFFQQMFGLLGRVI